jgi:hypothetical protein
VKREGRKPYSVEKLNKRRVDLDEIKSFSLNYKGLHNCDIVYKYISLSSRPIIGFFAGLLYYIFWKRKDNKPPYKPLWLSLKRIVKH